MWWSKKSDKKSGSGKNRSSDPINEKSVDPFHQARDIEEQQPAWKKPRTGDPEKKGPAIESLEVPPTPYSVNAPDLDSPFGRRKSSSAEPHSRKQSLVPFYVDEQAALAALNPPQPVYFSGRESPVDPFRDQRESEGLLSPTRSVLPPASSSPTVPKFQWGSTSTAVATPTAPEFTFGAAGSFDPLAHKEQLSTQRRGSAVAFEAPPRRKSSVAPEVPPPRRKSSSLDPHTIQSLSSRHEPSSRRKSSSVDPHTFRKPSISEDPNQKHLDTGNHSDAINHHITFAIPEDEEVNDVDAITLAKPPPTAFNPLFDTGFSLDGTGRRASDSLQNQHLLSDNEKWHPSMAAGRRKSSTVLVNRRASKYTHEEEVTVRKVGKDRLRWTRNAFIVFFICINCGFAAISWCFPKYWFVFAPVILLGNFLNTVMVLNLTRIWIQRKIIKLGRRVLNKPKTPPPTHIPTTIAMVLACYCESYEDLMRTLDSLSEQERVEHHKKMFIIIVDGQVKGKGMEKSTDRVLVEDIFAPTEEHFFPIGYESWDGVINGIYASAGVHNGIPYCCIVKKRNLGKRDGLILVRTLLYKYESRHENPISSMGNDFFEWFCNFSESHGIEKFEWLVGVDADTTFNKECIYELHKDVCARPELLGSSGLIQVGFQTGDWNLWNVYQNTEYIRAQCLRRMHQSLGTGKVSCLPGACQIIRICEESCGDAVLIDLFGSIPDPKANMIQQVRALAGEDRNYICLIFFNSPKVKTTMSMKAIAYTDPPNGFMVFLSQRKRWTLSTCANDMFIVSKNQMNWFERICSTADILCWGLPFFVMQTFALFIRACIHVDNLPFLLGFASLTIIPICYSLVVTAWGCTTWKYRGQYLLGLAMVITLSQFVTPMVIAYAIWHMDDFSWGKTRPIEDDGNPDNKPAHS